MPSLLINALDTSVEIEIGNDRMSLNASNSTSEEEISIPELYPTSTGIDTDDGDSMHHHHHIHDQLVKCVFLLLGIGFLLPWNAFISATAYFEHRICGADSLSGTDKQSTSDSGEDGEGEGGRNSFMLWFGLIYNLSGVMTLGLMLTLQRRKASMGMRSDQSSVLIDEDQHQDEDGTLVEASTSTSVMGHSDCDMSARKRQWRMIVVAFSFFLAVMTITTALVLVSIIDPFLFQLVSLTSAAVCGISGAFISAGIVSFANIFPPMIGIQPYITGQAVGGVVTSILKMVLSSLDKSSVDVFWESHCNNKFQNEENDEFLLSLNGDGDWLQRSESNGRSSSLSCPEYQIDWGAFGYFLIGGICISSCIGLFIYLDRHPVAEHYRALQGRGRIGTNQTQCLNQNDGIVPEESSQASSMGIDQFEDNAGQDTQLREPLLRDNESAVDEEQTSEPSDVMTKVWRKIKSPAISIFLTFFITITIFPSWVTKFESVEQCAKRESRLRNDLYIPSFIVLFNVFDFYGRSASGWVDVSGYSESTLQKKLSQAMSTRFIFLPIFLLLRVSESALVPPFKIFYNDWFPVIFTTLFAFTNGFVLALSFFQAALITPKTDEAQQIASTILNFAIGGGLVCGSFFSFIYNFIGTGQW